MITKKEFEEFCKEYKIKYSIKDLNYTKVNYSIEYKDCEIYKQYYNRRPSQGLIDIYFTTEPYEFDTYRGYKDFNWKRTPFNKQIGTGYGIIYLPQYLGEISNWKMNNTIDKIVTTGYVDLLQVDYEVMIIQNIEELRKYMELNLNITRKNYELIHNENLNNILQKYKENMIEMNRLIENNHDLREKIKKLMKKLSDIDKDME